MNKLFFYDKRILITGGTGTIGSQIIQELLPFQPHSIIVYSRDENEQAAMENQFKNNIIKFILGDIRDKNRLFKASRKVDYIFHTAALKHVNACEANPIEAVKTNILGTQNVIEAAILSRVHKVVLTSSDKAVNPTNTMGVTKLMAEKLMTAANFSRGSGTTIFASVRFGNVVGSRGSVIPIFKEQILKGGPVTVTNPAMTRFIMDNQDAVRLLFKAIESARGGEIFLAKMPVIKLGNLALAMVEELAPRNGYKPEDIEISIAGAKPGEKVYEELVSEDELTRVEEKNGLLIVKPYHHKPTSAGNNQSVVGTNSHAEIPMAPKELIRYLYAKQLL